MIEKKFYIFLEVASQNYCLLRGELPEDKHRKVSEVLILVHE